MSHTWMTTGLVIGSMILGSTIVEAKAKRRGFNFGTSFRSQEATDSLKANPVNDRETEISHESQAIHPYLGYSFGGVLNLGLSATFEQSSRHEVQMKPESTEKVEIKRDDQLNGAAIFSRFLFGRILFLEAGVGYYDRISKVEQAIELEQGGGQFQGSREDFSQRAAGAGYHLGGGLEYPMVYGFYFTTSYYVKTFNLREYQGSGNLGQKVSSHRNREFTFGLAHYYR